MVHRLACFSEYLIGSVTITLWGIGVRLRSLMARHPLKLTHNRVKWQAFETTVKKKGNIYSMILYYKLSIFTLNTKKKNLKFLNMSRV
jgi:hypothetical protein